MVRARFVYLRVPGAAWAGRAWAGDLDPADPRISPLYDDLSALPPMLIFQGDADILGPDTIEFARKAARAGVDVRLRVEPGASTSTSCPSPSFPRPWPPWTAALAS